jgi:carboxylesterase type B
MHDAYEYLYGTNISAKILLDSRASEDCLFLDVVVPHRIFETVGKTKAPVSKAKPTGLPFAKLIYNSRSWFGYTAGDIRLGQSPARTAVPLAGLFRQGEDGFVYVTINYRLGAFGWLSGPTFLEGNGVANAGLLDQQFALEWVQQYIHLFGGDPSRVTLMGESAGGGSILHQVTVRITY